MRTKLTWLAVVVAFLALGAAACGGDGDETPTAAPSPAATEDSHDEDEADEHDEEEADEHDEDDADDHEERSLFDEDAVQSLTIEMQDIKFVPETVSVRAGEVVELLLDNTGILPHDFTIERIDADHAYHEEVEVEGHGEHDEEFAMHHALEGGHGTEMRLRVHEPGEYEFWCTVPGHREAGMVGTLVVE